MLRRRLVCRRGHARPSGRAWPDLDQRGYLPISDNPRFAACTCACMSPYRAESMSLVVRTSVRQQSIDGVGTLAGTGRHGHCGRLRRRSRTSTGLYQRKSLCPISKPRLADVVKAEARGSAVGDSWHLRTHVACGVSAATWCGCGDWRAPSACGWSARAHAGVSTVSQKPSRRGLSSRALPLAGGRPVICNTGCPTGAYRWGPHQ